MNNFFMQSGWECPRCNNINSPFNPQCFCSIKTFTTYGTTAIKEDKCQICKEYHADAICYKYNV